MSDTSREQLARMMHDLVARANAHIAGDRQDVRLLLFAEGTRNERHEQIMRDYPVEGGSEFGLLSFADSEFEVSLQGETDLSPAQCGLLYMLPEMKVVRSLGAAGFHTLCDQLINNVQLVTATREQSPGFLVAAIFGVRTFINLKSEGKDLTHAIYALRYANDKLTAVFAGWSQLGVTTP